MAGIIDDKSQTCIAFILERLRIHESKHQHSPCVPPFFLGLNGVQGAGKTVLVRHTHTHRHSEQVAEKSRSPR